ncbi:unnamed protein product, partial [Prunus brigantina]
GAERLLICSDSQLVVNQVGTEFAAKDESMAAYLAQARRLLSQFKTYHIRQIPRSENSHADALSRLASAIDDRIGRHVLVEVLARRSTTEAEINTVRQDPSWMDPIHAYLTNGTLPTDRTEAKTVRRRSARYLLLQSILYRRSYSLPLLRCVAPQQGDYILREIHEGASINKIIKKTLKKKLGAAKGNWPETLPEALWSINTSYRRSTG